MRYLIILIVATVIGSHCFAQDSTLNILRNRAGVVVYDTTIATHVNSDSLFKRAKWWIINKSNGNAVTADMETGMVSAKGSSSTMFYMHTSKKDSNIVQWTIDYAITVGIVDNGVRISISDFQFAGSGGAVRLEGYAAQILGVNKHINPKYTKPIISSLFAYYRKLDSNMRLMLIGAASTIAKG